MKKKICFVIHRYGVEVNGGAELHCRQLAEHMTEQYDVTVLTTKAIDYITWKNEYVLDKEEIHGVCVYRFPVEYERNMESFSEKVTAFSNGEFQTEKEQLQWIREQGPYAPSLVSYIRSHVDEYNCFVFFTYLYYTTVIGILEAGDKAIVIPTAHDEPFLNMIPYKKVFELPRAIFYNTREEKNLIESKFPFTQRCCDIGGVGVEVPSCVDGEMFCRKYGLKQYMLYVGRIDYGKNCHILFDYFQRYKQRFPGELKLVLMGKNIIEIPENQDIVSLGFVTDEEKFAGLSAADFLVLPSEFESLSMVVLEAFSMRTPVLVNGKCEVLKAHCHKSNAGLYYMDYYEFEGCIKYFLQHPEVHVTMGRNGAQYVKENYDWKVIVERLSRLIESI